jgi:hypothetical protein
MNQCCIPISFGELYDKYSILQIKKEKIKDPTKLIYINKEINYLQPFIDKYVIPEELKNNIMYINKELWEIEDNIREKENLKEFDNEFITLARAVYITNDKRSIIKNNINVFLDSDIKEIKSYV